MKLVIYNLLILILIPVFVLRILVKSSTDSDYRKHFLNRFGYSLGSVVRENKKVIWFHAVSLGEVIGSEGIIRKLSEHFDVVITTTTPTGLRRAKQLFDDDVVINYAPWDFAVFINRFINFYKPDAILIFETEIWPSMISRAFKKTIPLYLINGRLSKKSYQTYVMSSWFLKDILRQITFSFVQTNKHRERFLNLGVDQEKIKTVGSVKFDFSGLDVQPIESNPFILGASTHPGEDEIILNAYNKFSRKQDFKLFLCPRHPERAEKIAKQASLMGFRAQLFSKLNSQTFDVCIIDKIGLLPSFYISSAMAFVGGSLVDTGCQNVLEPAALSLPILTGPSQYNFASICENLERKGGLVTVKDENQLTIELLKLLKDESLRHKMGMAARAVVNENQGALPKLLDIIERRLTCI